MASQLQSGRGGSWPPLVGWLAVASLLAVPLHVLVLYSDLYDWQRELADIPALPLVAGLVAAGLIYLFLPGLIRWSADEPEPTTRGLIALMVLVGFAFRLAMLATHPALEDDHYRYLWDGAVTAQGLNPYAVAPEEAKAEDPDTELGRLAEASGAVIERVNHPQIKTIYPPVAQAAFAIAHMLGPWDLNVWRAVCLAGEGITLLLLLALLAEAGRSGLWAALYWWNPVIIKELINSAHMEAIVTPLVLGALYLAVRRCPLMATGVLGLAVGSKLWPALLAPLIWRSLLASPLRLALAVLLLGAMGIAGALPPYLGGVDQNSGFVAYASYWATNSALFPVLEGTAAAMTRMLGVELSETGPGLLARAAIAGVLGVVAVRIAVPIVADPQDLLRRAGVVTVALFLLSPAQFPWYAAWFMPFLAFLPWWGLIAVTVQVPIYYASFHYHGLERYDVFRDWIVWAIWLPVWGLLAVEALMAWHGRRDRGAQGVRNA